MKPILIVCASLLLSGSVWAADTMPAMPAAPEMNKPATALPKEVPATATDAKGALAKAGKAVLVNVNTASAADLQKVPGIGPDKAKAIIEGRPYNSIEDLKKVKGIKEAVLAKIKPYVTVR